MRPQRSPCRLFFVVLLVFAVLVSGARRSDLSFIDRREKDKLELEATIEATYATAMNAIGPSQSELLSVVDDVLSEDGVLAREKEDGGLEERKAARKVRLLRFVVLASAYASIESLEGLVKHLAQRTKPPKKDKAPKLESSSLSNKESDGGLSADCKGATLTDFLMYLLSKGHFAKHAEFVSAKNVEILGSHSTRVYPDVEAIGGTSFLLLDSMMLRRLRDVRSFRENVAKKENDFTFLVPFGYEAINMFTLRFFKDQVTKLQRLLMAREEDSGSAADDDELEWMVTHIKSLALSRLPQIEDYTWKVDFIYPAHFRFLHDGEARKAFFQLDAAALMEDYLLAHFQSPLHEKNWRKIFETYSDDERTQKEIADVLLEYGVFHNFQMLGEFSSEISQQIEKHLSTADSSATMNDVRFMIPLPQKSFGVATMIFFMNHPLLSTENIVKSIGLLESSESLLQWSALCDPKFPCVILDDLAGSGESLYGQALNLFVPDFKDHHLTPKTVFVAPFVQTIAARLYFSEKDKDHSGVVTFASLPGNQLRAAPFHRPWMGGKGFNHGTYFISFPYMAPDNNCGFMAYIVAPLLVLDGLGSKTRYGITKIGNPPRLFRYLGLKLLRLLFGDHHSKTKQTKFPLFTLSTSRSFFLCDDGSRVPVLFHSDPGERTPDTDISLCRSGVWNWVLDENLEFSFGELLSSVFTSSLDGETIVAVSPALELGVSHAQLANDKQVYMAGQLQVSGAKVYLYVLPQFAKARESAAEHVASRLAHTLPRLFGCAKDVVVLDDALKEYAPPSALSFREACDRGYRVVYDVASWRGEAVDGVLQPLSSGSGGSNSSENLALQQQHQFSVCAREDDQWCPEVVSASK